MAPLAAIGGIVAGAAGIAGGVASITQSRQQAKATQQIADINAQTVLQEAAVNEALARRRNLQTIGRLRAAIGGRGITVEGTPLDVLAGEVAKAEEEALLIRFQAERRADIIRFGGQSEAEFAKAQGFSTALGQFGQAGGSILGGLGNLPGRSDPTFETHGPPFL
jgi:hypothetical protein